MHPDKADGADEKKNRKSLKFLGARKTFSCRIFCGKGMGKEGIETKAGKQNQKR